MNNKIMDSKELMKKIMEYGFAITDLGLYLDTHPNILPSGTLTILQ